jgi:hypothetical protein
LLSPGPIRFLDSLFLEAFHASPGSPLSMRTSQGNLCTFSVPARFFKLPILPGVLALSRPNPILGFDFSEDFHASPGSPLSLSMRTSQENLCTFSVLARFFKLPILPGVLALARPNSILELAILRALLLFPGLPRFFKLPILPGLLALARPNPIIGFDFFPRTSTLHRARSIRFVTS